MTGKLRKSAFISLLAILLCAAIALGGMQLFAPSVAQADTTASVWDGDLEKAGWGDAAKAEKPADYVVNETDHTVTIGSAAALAYFSHEVYVTENNGFSGYTVTLTCDVDLDNKLWIPIGFDHRNQDDKKLQHGFKGVFDGGEHTIYNFDGNAFLNAITFDNDSASYFVVSCDVKVPLFLDDNEFHYGLFGAIGNATIKNVNINDFRFDFTAVKEERNDSNITELIADCVGALVGFAAGTTTIDNCTVGNAKTDTIDICGTAVTGGIIGRAYTYYNETNDTFSGTGRSFTVTDCANYLNIGKIGDPAQKGGIVGWSSNSSAVLYKNCNNYGDINGAYIGGITSFIQQSMTLETVTFENCNNYGDLVANGYCNGGIIGRMLAGQVKVLKNCVNTGDITLIENRALGTGDTFHQLAGGIAGQVEQSLTRSFSASDLYNSGTITGAATDDTQYIGAKKGDTRYLYSYAGGIFGDLRITEDTETTKAWINGGSVESDYPYDRVKMSNLVNVGEVTVAGEYRGVSLYVGGLIGSLSSNQGASYNTLRVDAENFVNACGSVNAIDFYGNIVHDIRTDVLYRELGKVEPATEVTPAQLKLSSDGKTVLGLEGDYTGAIKVVIPNTVTAIADGAFAGMGTLLERGLLFGATASQYNSRQHIFQKDTPKLVAVEFEADSSLTTIGELAFAGTDIATVDIPASVKEVGIGSFAQTQLKHVAIGSSDIKLNDMAFGNNIELVQVELAQGQLSLGKDVFGHQDGKSFNVIAADKEQFESFAGTGAEIVAAYPVTIEYYDLGITVGEQLVGTETKLFGKPYTMIKGEDGNWVESAAVTYVGMPTLGAGATPWYADQSCTDSLTVPDLTEMLAKDGVTTIKLYTRTVGASTEFVAREDLVYDGTEYPLGAINALLASRSKKVTIETVEITAYTKFGATAPEAETPTAFRNAGTYVVAIGDEEITITIARAKIYLSNVSTLEWRVNGSITLLDRDGLVDSVVRSRGANVPLTLDLHNAPAKGYTVSNPVDDTQTGAGDCTSTFTLTADDNHEFVDGTVIDADARGLEITPNDNGTFTVKKTWHVVDMDNWFVGADNNDYAVADRVYGSTAAFAVPALVHGTESDITLELYKDGAQVGQAFTVAELGKYLNSMMPVGEYVLRMNAKAVDYDEYDEYDDEGNPVESSKRTLHCAAFHQDVAFAVTPATLSAAQAEAINTALNGVTFKFIVGDANMSADNTAVQNAVNAALEQLRLAQPSVATEGNVWTANTAAITVNPAAAMSNVYGEFTKPTTAGVYNYYYKLSLANYDAIESEDGKLLCFTVVAYGVVEIPTIAEKVFNNTQQTADIVGNGQYSVTANDGGVGAGEYDVVLTLLQPECYLWKGQTVDNNTATQTLKFKIGKADNTYIVALNMLGWNFETFDAAINNIRASARYLDDGQKIHFRVVKEGETTALAGLADFTVDENGQVDKTVAAALKALKVGKYVLYAKVNATDNYNELERNVSFAVGKAVNTWADGENDIVLPSWIVGRYNEEDNPIVINAAHGKVNIRVEDLDGNVYYNSVEGINNLNDLKVGKYLVKAWVDETEDYTALPERAFTIEVLEKAGLPWWAVLLIVIGSLGVAALVLWILHEKGVLQMLTGKIVIAMRTRMTVDATIAAVRANKRAEESKKSIAKAEQQDRIDAARKAREEERNKSPEERAATLEEKAAAEVAKAEKSQLRAEKLKQQARKLKGEEETPETDEEEAAEAEVASTEETTNNTDNE